MSVILKIVLPLVLTLGLVDCSSSDTKKTDKLPKTDAKTQITYPVNSAEDPVEIDVPVVPPIVPPPILPVGPIDGSARTGNKDNDDSCNDSDADGVCDGQDACVGFDDNLDADQDGYPTACDCNDTDASVFPGVECNPSAVPNEECRYLICRVSLDRGGNQVANCANEPKEDFTLCGNEPLGLCDKQDYCHSGECIDDQHPISYQCNNDLTECDVPDHCDGINDDCPRTYVVAGVPCGNEPARGALCDAQDECDGAGNCIDEVQNSGFICGINSGTGCDVTDVCNGFDKDCFNTVLASGTLCGNSAQGECDLHDVCNSQGECLDIKRLPGAICEFSHGICQPGSTCDGVSNDCPFAAPTPPGVPCGPNNLGVCTGQGRCSLDSCPNATGLGVDNDSDGFSTDCDCNDANAAIFPGTVCVASGCSETICNFATAACDIVSNYSQGTVCGPDQPANSCTKNPVCDGDGTCLNNEFQASDYPCRLSTGVCDAEEFCTGISGTCPIDSFIPAGTVCGNENDLCLSAGTCDGSTANCSGSVNAPDGDTNALCIAGIDLPSPIVSSDHCPGTQNGSYVCSQGVAYCYADNAVELNLSCYGDDNYNIDSGNFANDNTNHNVQGGDNLGWSEAAYGNYVASGAPSYDLPSNGDDIGAVFVSTVDAPSAASLNNLIIPNPNTKPNGNNLSGNESEKFGYSVALHGDYLIVGAPQADYYYDGDINDPCTGTGTPASCLTESLSNAGAAYIFVRNGVNWDFQAKLQGSLVGAAGNLYPTDVDSDDSGLFANDQFGWDVAINGDYAVVGAPFADGANDDVGNVRVYHRSGSTWTYLQIIGTPVDQNAGEQFGYALSISPNGQALAVSMPFYDDNATNSNNDRGVIYLYTSNGTGGNFSLVISSPFGQNPTIVGDNSGDQAGFDLALSNNFIVFGVPHLDTGSYDNNGAVYIMNYDSNGYYNLPGQFKVFIGNSAFNQNSLFFGTSVSIGRSDDHAFVVGTPYYDSSEGDDSGLIAVYSINQSMNTITPADFNLVSYVDGDDYVAGSSQFGYSVATDSNIVGVGAPFNDSHSNSDSGSTSLFFYPY